MQTAIARQKIIVPDGIGSLEKTEEIVVQAQLVQMIDGTEMYLYQLPGLKKGISVAKADLDSGEITEQQIYDSIGQMWLDEMG